MGINSNIIYLLLICLEFGIGFCRYPEFYIEDRCIVGNESVVYETFELGTAGTLKAIAHPSNAAPKNCTITIKPHHNQDVVLSIRDIRLSPTRQFNCKDYLQIFHAGSFESPAIICGFLFDDKEHKSYFSKGPMTIIYHISASGGGNQNDLFKPGFTLTYTVVSKELNSCKSDEFQCDNGRCIQQALICDHRNNCGDRSDESYHHCSTAHAQKKPSFNIFNIIYITIFTLVVIMFGAMLYILCLYRRSRKSNKDSDSSEDLSTIRLSPYQAIHPSGYFICQNPAGPSTLYPQSSIVHPEGGFTNPCYPTGVPQSPPPYRK